jgi:hypothetical protein
MNNEQARRILNEWIPALRSGDYEQAKGSLAKCDRYCCLGVMCDIVFPHNWEGDLFYFADDIFESLPPVDLGYDFGLIDGFALECPPDFRYTTALIIAGVVPSNYGDGDLSRFNAGINGISLSELNDDDFVTFTLIADLLEIVANAWIKYNGEDDAN